jgi:hypothetical protein
MTSPPAALAFDDATRVVAVQYAAGVSLDAIDAHHHDVSAQLLSDARTAHGRAYAAEYASTTETLIADLRADAAAALGREPTACALPDGAPHPDPVLAAKGWHVHRTPSGGVYARGQREAG